MGALRRGTSASGVRSVVVALVAVVAMVMTCVSGILPVARADGQTVDLTATVSGLAQSAPAGSNFESMVTVRNISSADAANAAFSLTLSDGFTGVTVQRVSAEGGATGPENIAPTVTKGSQPGLSDTARGANATVNLPANSSLVYKVSGRYPSSSSASVTASVQPQVGDTDSEPSSNTARQQVNLDSKTDVSIDVKQDEETTKSGQTRHYHVTFTNKGPAAVVDTRLSMDMSFDFPANSNMQARIIKRDYSCSSTGGAVCSGWAGDSSGAQNQMTYKPYQAVSGLLQKLVYIPAGGSVTYDFAYDVEVSAQEKDATDLSLPVKFYARTGEGILRSEAKSVEGTVTGATTILSNVNDAQVTLRVDPTTSPVNNGDKVRYTFSLTNDGQNPIDTLKMYMSIRSWSAQYVPAFDTDAQYALACVGENGAVCPTDYDGTSKNMDRAVREKYIISNDDKHVFVLPVNGKLSFTLDIDAKFAGCFPTGSMNLSIYSGIVGPRGANLTVKKDGDFSTVVVNGNQCVIRDSDIRVARSTDSDSLYSGKEHTYVTRYENHGDNAVNGIGIAKGFRLNDHYYNYSFVTECTAEGEAVCPKGYPHTEQNNGWYEDSGIYGTSIDLPAHSALIFTTKAIINVTKCVPDGRYPVTVDTTISMPRDARNLTNMGSPYADSTISCNDVSSQTSLRRSGQGVSQTDPDTDLTVVSRVSNSVGVAENVAVSVTTPQRAFVAASDAMPVCSVVSGDAVCPTDLKWDAAQHVITGTVPRLAAGAALEVSLAGKSGVVPTTVDSGAFTTTTVSDGDTSGDNTSQATISYANQKVPVKLTQRIEGLSAAGMPADMEFTGVLSCATQDDVPVTLTVKKGESEASTTVDVWKQSNCTLTMQAPEKAPEGYVWESTDPVSARVSDVDEGKSLTVSRRVRALVVPADITVRYVTVDAQNARHTVQSQKLEKNVGDSYETSALDIDGFKLAVTPDNAKGTVSSADPVIVEYLYVPVGAKSTKPVAFGTRYVADPSLGYKTQVERTAGVNGEDTMTTSYALNAQGHIEAKDTTSRSKDPVERVVAVGNVEKKTLKRVIHYVDKEDTSKQIQADTTQQVNWQRTDTVNATTGALSEGPWSAVAQADRSFPAVDAPSVEHYTNPSVKSVPAARVLATNPVNAGDVTITYEHVKTSTEETRDVTRTITYVDAVTGKSIDEKQNVTQKVTLTRTNVRDEVTGKVAEGTWSTDQFPAVDSPSFDKYAAADMKTVAALDVNGETARNTPVTVSYPQGTGTAKESKIVTREVTFIAKDTGDQLGDPVEQKVELTRENTVNLVTGDIVTAGEWSTGDLPAVAALTIAGYTPLSQGAAELTVTGEDSALVAQVEYEKTPEPVTTPAQPQTNPQPKPWTETRPAEKTDTPETKTEAAKQTTRVSTLARTGTDIQFISLMVLLATAAGIALTMRKNRA